MPFLLLELFSKQLKTFRFLIMVKDAEISTAVVNKLLKLTIQKDDFTFKKFIKQEKVIQGKV